MQRIDVTTGKPFGDGSKIIYANGKYCGESDVGKLMDDFRCPDPDRMHYKLFADKARYLKENPKGVREMCEIMEELVNETKTETLTDFVRKLLSTGKLTHEEISACSGLDIKDVESLAKDLRKQPV